MSTYEEIRTQLQTRLATLTRRADTIERDLRGLHDADSEEQAAELENDEVLEGLDEMTLGEVRQIQEALARIDKGTYGVCTGCGKTIAVERLTALPSTPTCVDCA